MARKFRREEGGEEVQRILINMILDKSGSMATRVNDVIGGFNTYVEELRKDDKSEYRMSLTLFDTSIDLQYKESFLGDVDALSTATYQPSGGTALFDAIGETVSAVDASDMSKVITVIMTDGEENSSKAWTIDRVKELIDTKEKEGNWTFVFMGENLEVAAQAVPVMGAYMANTVRYNSGDYKGSFVGLASASVNLARSERSMSVNFFAGNENENIQSLEDAVAPMTGGKIPKKASPRKA